jgi:macrolide-specific efflux system membrane fusion protein
MLVASVAVVALGQERQPTSGAAGQRGVMIEHGQVFLIEDVQVPAREAGVITRLEAGAGEQVPRGRLLGQIDDRQSQYAKLSAELEREAALERAGDDIEVRYAEASLGVAEAELKQNEEINRRSPGSVSAAEMRRLKLTRHRAELQIVRSRLDLKIAGMTADVHQATVAAAEENIDRRKIVAPFDGVVVDVLRQRGEWVDAGEPVLRLIRLDRVRVEGFFDASQFNPEEVSGRPVTVEIERAHGQRVRLPGTVVFISPLVQAGNKYRVRVEVENHQHEGHWLLGPGMNASMVIHIDQPRAK